MGHLKIIIRKDKERADGTQPLYLRMIEDRKVAYLSLKEYIHPEHWNKDTSEVKKGNPHHLRLNLKIRNRMVEATELRLELEKTVGKVSAREFINILSEREDNDSFNYYAAKHLKNIREFGSSSRYRDEAPMVKVIKDFNDQDIHFYEINKNYLEKFQEFIRKRPKVNSERTVSNYVKLLKAIYNMAVRDGVINNSKSPFKDRIKSPSAKESRSSFKALEKEEIEKIIQLELEPETTIWHTKNAWLLSYYIAGARVRDLIQFKWGNIIQGRLEYQMGKNNKFGAIKIADPAFKILGYYKDSSEGKNEDYILPFLVGKNIGTNEDFERVVSNVVRLFNKHLKIIAAEAEIFPQLSMHTARHSFAYWAKLNQIDIVDIQKMLRHSDVKTTAIYLSNFMRRSSDDPIDKMYNN
jgi:integrase/recombinase XerD